MFDVYWETGSLLEGTISFHHERGLTKTKACARARALAAELKQWVCVMRKGIEVEAYCGLSAENAERFRS